jgi:heterodisulfide reductase subunit C
MLWSCLGCYQCQEACPQGVHITDIFYELKNIAIDRLKGNGESLLGGEWQ